MTNSQRLLILELLNALLMKINLKLGFGVLTVLFLIVACGSKKNAPLFLGSTPPNGIRIQDNFYCDQTEVTNFNWMEYMLSIKRTYGTYSAEHLATLPDTNVWKGDTNYRSYPKYYLRHPAYRDYPVVGISQEQAVNFTNWRSDRVFEYLLIREGVFQYDTVHRPEDNFTIEKYFRGEYFGLTPDTSIKYYPDFRLPTFAERAVVLKFADSLKTNYLKNCKGKKCEKCKAYNYWVISAETQPEDYGADAMASVGAGCIPYKYDPIHHLIGNSAEWLDEVGLLAGGSWDDKLDSLHTVQIGDSLIDYLQEVNAPTRTSGFRNVFEWKLASDLKLD